MAAVIKTLLISSLTDANPYTIGSAPDNLTGYIKPSGSDNARVSSSTWYLAGATETMWLDATILSGTTIFSRVKIGATASPSAAGAVIADINGTGYEVIFGTTAGSFRVFATLNGRLTGSVLAGGTFATPPVANAWIELSHTGTTLTVKQNGTTLGSVTDITRPTNARAGMSSRGGVLVGIESEYEAAQSIVSINSGNPITANQTTVASVTTGFTGLPTSITCDLAGITCSSIGGTTNAPTFVKSQRVHGSPWPINGATATFTYVNGSETASGTQVIQKEAGDVVYTFSSVITDDPASIGYWLTQDGFTVEGGEHSYTPYGDLVLTADGGGSVGSAGTFTSWFRPSTGTGAGNVYSYTWTISEAGIAVVSRGQMPSLAIGYGIGI